MMEMCSDTAIGRTSRRPRASLMIWIAIGIFSCSAIGFSHWLTRSPVDNSEEIDFIRRFEGGTLVIAGGGPLPPEIRRRFLDFAGGPEQARLMVIPAFDMNPDQSEKLIQTWRDMDVKSVQVLHATSREMADRNAFVQPIDEATGVWLSGGTQDWLSRHYAGTLVEQRLQALIERGG